MKPSGFGNRRRVALVGWLVLTVLVVIAVRSVDGPATLAAVRGARLAWLLPAALANAFVLVLATIQWRAFLPTGRPVRFGEMFRIVAITSTVSNGGPTLAGHATAVQLLATRGRLGHSAGLSILALDQLAEGLAKLGLVVLAALFVPLPTEYRAIGLVLGVGVPALAVLLAATVRYEPHLRRAAASQTGRIGRILKFAVGFASHLDALRSPARFAWGTVLAMAQKVAEAGAIAMVLVAFGIALPWWSVLAILVAVTLFTLVSITPANLGTYEASAFLVLRAVGVDSDLAVAVALALHLCYLAPMAGVGWITLGIEVLRPARR